MSALEVLRRAADAGVAIFAEGDKIAVVSRTGIIPSDLRRDIVAERVSVLREVVSRDQALSVRVVLFALLPRAATLVLRSSAVTSPVLFTSSRTRAEASRGRELVFTPLEYEAILPGVIGGVTVPSEFALWCTRKAADPAYRITPGVVGAPLDARESQAPVWWQGARSGRGAWVCGWTMERLVAALGVDCVGVETEGA